MPKAPRGPAPARPGIDWDAATAAALADDASETAPSVAAPAAATTSGVSPDGLVLDEIIREIVGDAAVDTASSLQPPTPALTPPPVSVAAPAPASAPAPAPESASVSASEPAHAATTAATHASARTEEPPTRDQEHGRTRDHRDLDSHRPHAPATDAPRPILAIEDPALAVGAARPPSAPPPLAAPASPVTVSTITPAPAQPQIPPALDDVSRETSRSPGGTPLADELMNATRRRVALEEAVLPLPETTRVFTISNQKGGVGKTTTTVNLAAALARAGARVLVIDMDPQGNASTALGVDHRSEQRSVYEVLVQDLPLGPVVRPSAEHERLDCVPATIHLAGAEIELVSLVAREQRLRRALDAHLGQMDEPYHYVFIDCPPSLGLLTINAFVAAREVLIPIQCEYYALEGLSQLLSNIELIEKHLNPSLQLSTILLTMYDSRTNLAQQVAQEVREHFQEQTLGTIIPRSVRVSEAPSYGQSVISYDYGSSGSLSYREAAAEIARRGAPAREEKK
jgi:cellulose biosynthesis protein BcsQ